MGYLKNAPPSLIRKIQLSRQSIEAEKARAKDGGRPYVETGLALATGSEQSDLNVFERLASHADMAKVWDALAPIFDDEAMPPDTWRFADVCAIALKQWKYSPKRTAKEHRDHFTKIAFDLRNIAERVSTEPEFGAEGIVMAPLSPVDMLSDEDLSYLVQLLDARCISKFDLDCARMALVDGIPRFTDYMEWLASKADKIASEPSISERPHRPSAERTFFVRALSSWFLQRYKAPMHEVVAGIASAVLDEPVTADNVRKLVRQPPPEVS